MSGLTSVNTVKIIPYAPAPQKLILGASRFCRGTVNANRYRIISWKNSMAKSPAESNRSPLRSFYFMDVGGYPLLKTTSLTTGQASHSSCCLSRLDKIFLSLKEVSEPLQWRTSLRKRQCSKRILSPQSGREPGIFQPSSCIQDRVRIRAQHLSQGHRLLVLSHLSKGGKVCKNNRATKNSYH